jgi:hypothetical protein
MTIEEQLEWLALLEAELARREAKAQWDAGEDERQAEQFLDELRQMAERHMAVNNPVSMFDHSYGRGPPQLVEDTLPASRLALALFGQLEPEKLTEEVSWLDAWFKAAGYRIRVADFRQMAGS